MKPYPLELRQWIVEAVDQQYVAIEEVAEILGITERYVYRLLKLRQSIWQ
jgi:transposase